MITSTMMDDLPLTVTQLFRHGSRVHAEREVVTWLGDASRRVTFAETADRTQRLAAGLASLGVQPGDVVGTFMWNNQEHVEAYFAVPCMGAVLHTLNIRLSADQLDYVIRDGGDRVILVDGSLIGLLAQAGDALRTVEHVVVVGEGDVSLLDRPVIRYDDLLRDPPSGFAWPHVEESAASMLCHTSGTTGSPKGVAYSHRSQWTHAMGAAAGGLHVSEGDRSLIVVPQFHANAWGLIYICWAMGSDILQPGPFLQPEPLVRFIEAEQPNFSAAVPTVWNGVLQLGRQTDIDMSSLQRVVVGGAAVPRSMVLAFDIDHGVKIVQGWGMTEMSPLGTLSIPPASAADDPETQANWRAKTGRLVPGVELRIVDGGIEQPWDGQSVGEVQVRGPWIARRYHNVDDPEKFTEDGWLRTGDVGLVEPNGFMQVVDRTKDVIKSGGEWISSVDLENAIIGHPEVVEATVIGIPDDKWTERPLACVVLTPHASTTPSDLQQYLADKVAKWWIPERWTFIEEVPKTSVGKYDKKLLRAQHREGSLAIQGPADG